MRIVYLLLSPTFGMHQYTADLAGQMVRQGHEVHVITTATLPVDRYGPEIRVHTPVSHHTTGFGREGWRVAGVRAVAVALAQVQPQVVHFTGVHLWNPLLLAWLSGCGVATVHSLHDLDPHRGVRAGGLIRLWNGLVLRLAGHLLVHGQVYRDRLLAQGRAPGRVTWLPLLHSCLGAAHDAALQAALPTVRYEPWVLFFARLEAYKGVTDLLAAAAMLAGRGQPAPLLVLAGRGDLQALWPRPLPPGVIWRQGLIDDALAADLFGRCSAVVLPYTSATQSALPAAAYAYGKPVIVTDSGALPEYVQPGQTGWVVPPRNPAALAACIGSALAQPASLPALGLSGRQWYDQQRQAQPALLEALYSRAICGQCQAVC